MIYARLAGLTVKQYRKIRKAVKRAAGAARRLTHDAERRRRRRFAGRCRKIARARKQAAGPT